MRSVHATEVIFGAGADCLGRWAAAARRKTKNGLNGTLRNGRYLWEGNKRLLLGTAYYPNRLAVTLTLCRSWHRLPPVCPQSGFIVVNPTYLLKSNRIPFNTLRKLIPTTRASVRQMIGVNELRRNYHCPTS